MKIALTGGSGGIGRAIAARSSAPRPQRRQHRPCRRRTEAVQGDAIVFVSPTSRLRSSSCARSQAATR